MVHHMTEKEVFEMIEKRRQEEPEFRKKYDAFLASRKAEGKLSDSELPAFGPFFSFMILIIKKISLFLHSHNEKLGHLICLLYKIHLS